MPKPPRRPTPDRTTEPTPRPRLVGLTGGIGSGKSAALAAFRRLGADVLSSDEVVHSAYADPDLIALVRDRFGDGVLDAGGGVDRAALRLRALAEPGGLTFLEHAVHPRVAAARAAWQEEMMRRDPPPRLLVCEVPLLFEAGIAGDFDTVLVVTASDDVRRRRVEARGQDYAAISARQLPEREKIARADAAFVNDGGLADLEAWVRDRFAELVS